MKKIYMIPDVKVVKVQPRLLTTVSMAIGGETDIVESRRRGDDFWDDDDDDEY